MPASVVAVWCTVADTWTVSELCKRGLKEKNDCIHCAQEMGSHVCDFQLPCPFGILHRLSFLLVGSLAVSDKPSFSKSHPTEGKGERTRRASLCALEPQERQ